MGNNRKLTREELEQLPDEQLHEHLREVLSGDVPDAELYRLLMDILKERGSGDAQTEACQENEKLYIKKTRRVWKWAAVAAVLVCVLTVSVPTVMGNTQVLDTLGKWKDNIVAFFTGEEPQPEPYTFKTEHSGLQEIYDTISNQGVIQPVVPTWVPEGYQLVEIKSKNAPNKIKVNALMSNGEKAIVFTIEIYGADVLKKSEADEPDTLNVEVNGINHQITSNDGAWVAKWTRDNLECSLTVDGEKDVLYAILRSIYTMEE